MGTQSIENFEDIANLTKKICVLEKQVKSLSKSTKKYKNFFDISSDAIFILDLDCQIIDVNKVVCERYEYSANECLSKHFIEFFSKSAEKQFNNIFKKLISDISFPIETEHVTKNQQVIPVELNAKIFNYENKNLYLITARDISYKKINQEQLENERNLFKTLMDNIPDRIYFKDVNSKFTFVNKAQIQNFQLTNPTEVIGKCDHDFFDKRHADQALKDEKKILKTKKAIISKIEKEKIQLQGREYEWVNSTKVPIINKSGNVTGLVGISRDVTDLKTAENKVLKYAQELKYLNATKDKFFSIIAHDLKNPFFSLLGFSELLIKNYEILSDEEKKEYINNITKISKNSYQLLENLLNWARAQTGRIEYCPKEIDLKILIDDITEFFDPIARKKKITVENVINQSLNVYADQDMMRTIIRNLLTNAIKFTPNDGFIRINSIDRKDHYKIVVTDSGRGMDAETLNKLFRIDVNHKSLGTSNEVGTGLGLIICKEFVEKNGGQITISSKIGKGSKFSFTVPKYT